MSKNKPDISLQYLGFKQTNFLWTQTPLLGLKQFYTPTTNQETENICIIEKKYRLGHLVEQFVFHELEQQQDITILAKNVQIRNEQQTIGEIDCILEKATKSIHLEIVYKFYLYDSSVGQTELEHWIGPNRKDSFIEKITKLNNKQLPLLYKPETEAILNKLDLDIESIEQHVYFKAQLFVPYKIYNSTLRVINNLCVCGYYLSYNDFITFSNHSFYIPEKLDWLVTPHKNVIWLDFDSTKKNIQTLHKQKKSPLCWSLSPEGMLQKLFIVWW